VRETGNIFLTNIHRVFLGDVTDPSLEDDDLRDYFLDPFGPKPVGRTNDSQTDLGEIIREVDELAVFNDEAHHIHDKHEVTDAFLGGGVGDRTEQRERCASRR
jgi:type III restriction enzyme